MCLFVIFHKRLIAMALLFAVVAPLATAGLSYAAIAPHQAYIIASNDRRGIVEQEIRVGLVLGAGITKDGKPYKELRSRLDVAADALQAGQVKKLILSGDNRFAHYDEPTAMKRYLVEQRGISAEVLQEDFAGRSTYESCERAAKVFQLDKVVIFSAGSHLPRAIYLCRQLGVEAYGIASTAEANNAVRRETVARVKALVNVYINGENTLLGPAIRL